jgi:flagellar basal body L-ring protein FlgH
VSEALKRNHRRRWAGAPLLFESFVPYAALVLLASCGSLADLKAALTGEDQVQTADGSQSSAGVPARGPASIVAYDNRSPNGAAAANGVAVAEAAGPDLSANEFGALARQSSERSALGYRRDATPWDGTGAANEGSLWNPDAQDGFYFTKNLLFKIGDVVVVKIEPEVNQSLNFEIAGLLGRTSVGQVVADEAGRKVASEVEKKVSQAVGSEAVGAAVGAAAGAQATSAIDPNVRYVDISDIPVRIIETLPRNSYRVEGARRIYIKNAPYQIKLTGVLRDEDIGPQRMVASSRLFESKMELTK